ncbi:MAG: amidase [Pseudomonadota bacterium]
MTIQTALKDTNRLVCETGEDLAQIAQRFQNPSHRRAFYAELTARRNIAEPTVNAFEHRREACPETVTGPLNGLPITVKDQIAVAGWPTGFGMERMPRKPDSHSAPLVTQLRALGACVTGKTALPPNAMDFQTSNKRRGPTRNPHNPDFTAGGSTGGGAAAVASGMSLLDVGADLAGSLRIPAAWCGVTSYTPTEGFWPNDGLLRGAQKLDHFARIGLTARTASDLAYIWGLIQSSAATPPASAHIALWSPSANAPCDHETQSAWQRFGEMLASTHPNVTPNPMTALFEIDVYRLAGEIIGYETGALVPWLIRWFMRRDQKARETSPGFVAHVHEGYKRDRIRHGYNLKKLAQLRAMAFETWAEADALLLPVTGVCAFKHLAPIRDQSGVRTYDKIFDTAAGKLGYFDALTRFTVPLTALGWPVVTLRVGIDSNGIPIGAQLVGKPGADGALLALAKALQAELEHPTPRT